MSPGCKETAGLGDVAGDLGDEGFFVREDLVVAEFLEEFNADLAAVQLAVIIQHMKLANDGRVFALERRAAANVTEAVVRTARP